MTAFFRRMLLRDYSVIESIQKKQPHHVNLNFAELATGGWLFLASMALVSVACLVFKSTISPELNLVTAPKPVRLAIIFGVVLAVSTFVSRLARPYRDARPVEVDQFKTRSERRKWWFATLSLVPLATIFGGSIYFAAHV